jgi:hypothetical protein
MGDGVIRDGVMRAAERLEIWYWSINSRDKDSWKLILESAKTLHGL